MAVDDYIKAQRLGQRSYHKYLMEGRYPYLQVLEELLSHTDVVAEEKLGVVAIPSELLVGTYSSGRRTAFAPDFMPLLEPGTEFAGKWATLCEAHLTEGIRDPIKCYEFMNRYYVMEGNKRVSVLKYFKALTIPGNVIRLIPKRTDEPENKLYFEFLDFYKKTRVNYIIFTKLGSYKKLLGFLDVSEDYEWSEDDRMNMRSVYVRFEKSYRECAGSKLPIPVADAFLVYLEFYPYSFGGKEKMPAEMKSEIKEIWDEILMRSKSQPSEIMTEPADAPKKNFFDIFLPSGSGNKLLKIAFIHDKNAQTSAWTYGHELGRMYIEEEFKGGVETMCYDNISQGESLEAAFDDAIGKGADIIFTTTPQFLDTSVKVAVKNPQVKILNCSVDTTHQCIRTYYARMYEGKFLSGLVAGALCTNGKIGYMADYPINGMISNINAFAIGVKTVNPSARIRLEWTTVRDKDEILADFKANGVQLVSAREMIRPDTPSRIFGLLRFDEDRLENITATMWNWGALYKKLVETIQNGAWSNSVSEGIALNYWWGMNAGVVDFICSDKVPSKTRQLVEFMKCRIMEGGYHPFYGELMSQDGIIQTDDERGLSPEEIINMSWLADNIDGKLPHWNKLNDDAKAIVEIQGVDNIDS